MTTKILILNAGLSNKGNRALVTSTIEAINMFTPDAEFNLMGSYEVDRHELHIKKQICCGLGKPRSAMISIHYLFKCGCMNLLKRLNVHIPISKNSQLFEYYDSNIVINSGGDQLSGEYGISTLSSFVNIICPILLDKPVILYGESLGYFKNPILNSIAKFIFSRTKLILVREEISKKYLYDNNITSPIIHVTADPAFLLSVAPESRVFEILSEEGIEKIQNPLIGINPSGLISRFSGKSHEKAEEEFTSIMAKIIDNLAENLKATIIMIPHVYTPNDDDRISINRIYHEVKDKSNIEIIKNEYTPQELKGIIGLCDLFIGARMHATIASTSMLVPTIGIAYSHKMHGIIGKMLGQEKYVLNIDELEYETLISKVNDAWENREMIKKELETKIPKIKNKAMLNGKYVKDLLDSLENS